MTRYLLAAVAALSLASCTDPCVKLAEKICECQPSESAKDTCNQEAADRASQFDVSEADEERCDRLLDGCDCHKLDTPEGKMACGVANFPPQ